MTLLREVELDCAEGDRLAQDASAFRYTRTPAEMAVMATLLAMADRDGLRAYTEKELLAELFDRFARGEARDGPRQWYFHEALTTLAGRKVLVQRESACGPYYMLRPEA